jgi:hypothetical protein
VNEEMEMAGTIRTLVESEEWLEGLRKHLNRGLLALHPEAIAEILKVEVKEDVLQDGVQVAVVLLVRPSFVR